MIYVNLCCPEIPVSETGDCRPFLAPGPGNPGLKLENPGFGIRYEKKPDYTYILYFKKNSLIN